ncbi:MAG: ribokinase [Pseudomonadota bacterium]
MSKLVVIGSSNTDMIIQVPRLPGPGETILGGTFDTAAGGKGANQAVAAARAGCKVSFIAAVGDDMFGEKALKGFEQEGIYIGLCVIDANEPSGVAQIFVDGSGENCIGVAPGANSCLEPGHIDRAAGLFGEGVYLLLQLETPLDTVAYAARLGKEKGCTVILNPAPAAELPDDLLQNIDYLTPNTNEAGLLTGISVTDDTSAGKAAAVLHKRGCRNVIITRGGQGVFVSQLHDRDRHSTGTSSAYEVEALDTTAAGDVFNGCLAARMVAGDSLESAINYAQAAAALSVQVLGAQDSAPTHDAVQRFLQPL